MNIIKLASVFIASVFSLLVFAGEAPVSLTPEPTKGLVVKTCESGYYLREKPRRCLTTEFLERRGEDLVFLVQENGGGEKKEAIFNKDLGTKVRPFPYATYKPHSYFLQFPMKNGNSWSGVYEQEGSGRIQNRSRGAEIVGYGDITLPAGVFKAYEIRAVNQLSGASRPAMEKYFYCPALAMICSYESQEFDMYLVVVEVKKND